MVHPPKVDAEEVVILTADQIGDVLTKLTGSRPGPIVAIALGAGLRRGEICGFRWGDIDGARFGSSARWSTRGR
jgi:integrase